jgi:proline iminopeptidase
MKAGIRDTEIFFDIEGVGLAVDGAHLRERPVAFIIHGGPGGDHSSFKPILSPLAERMQLVYFDHRGQGRSGRGDPARYTLDENVEDMEALRRHLGLGPVVSIGTSYGGMVAQAHAARYPAGVSHLILVVTAAHGGFIAKAKAFVAERGTAEQRRVCEPLWTGAFKDEAQLREFYAVMGPLYSRRHDPAGGSLATRRTIYNVEALNRAFGGFLKEFDLRPELPRITAPTLVLAGRHDWICPPEFSEEIARLIPGAELRIFEESSHSIRADEPQAFMDTIKGFVYQGRSLTANAGQRSTTLR